MNQSSTFHPERRTLAAATLGTLVGIQCAAAAVALFAGGFRTAWESPADASPASTPFYDLTGDDARVLWDGEQTAIASCMQQRGFEYTPARFTEVGAYPHAAPGQRDLEALRRDGYGVAERFGDRAAASRAPDTTPGYAGEPGKFVDALLGPDLLDDTEQSGPGWERAELAGGASMYWYSDSCVARGFRDIYGPLHPHDEIPLALERWRSAVSTSAGSDPTYQSALNDWRACMLERGYTLGDPGAARELLEGAASAPGQTLERLTAHELAIASADATCDMEADLEARARDARRRAVLATPAPDAGWPSLAGELAVALERARQTLSAGSARLAPRMVARLDAPSAS